MVSMANGNFSNLIMIIDYVDKCFKIYFTNTKIIFRNICFEVTDNITYNKGNEIL